MLRHLSVWIVFAMLSFAALGCGGGSWAYNVMGTQRDPGSEGTVQVERIEGGNRLVTVSFRHMTPPERLGGNLRRFVMWFRNPQGQSTMASNIEYDPASRTGRATATTPLTQFLVIVTAEGAGAAITQPSENVIFNQRVSAE